MATAPSAPPPAYGSVPEQQVRLLDDSSGSDVKSVGTNTLTHEQAKDLLVKFVDSKSCYSSAGLLSFSRVFSRYCSFVFSVAAKNCTITGVSSAASCHVQLNSFLETRTVATVSVGSVFVCLFCIERAVGLSAGTQAKFWTQWVQLQVRLCVASFRIGFLLSFVRLFVV